MFLTPEELARWAEERARVQGPFSMPEEKLLVMLDFIRNIHYHIVSTEIQEACKRQIGFTMEGTLHNDRRRTTKQSS